MFYPLCLDCTKTRVVGNITVTARPQEVIAMSQDIVLLKLRNGITQLHISFSLIAQ